jgi:hypothetical protein
MNKDNICIVSVGLDGREKYSEFTAKLEHMAKKNGYDAMVWKNEFPPDSPTHKEVPYAFKPFAIRAAALAGYTKILWMDSKCYILDKIVPVEKALEEDGYWFLEDGGSVGEWCSDSVLPLLGITREEGLKMKVIAAKHFALNFEHKIARDFFDAYLGYATDDDGKAYIGPWTNENQEASTDERVQGHRHDQTCASMIVNRLDMKISDNRPSGNIVVDWRDGWKYGEKSKYHNPIKPLILFDGYLHGTAMNCTCPICLEVNEGIVNGEIIPPPWFWRDACTRETNYTSTGYRWN